MLAGTPVLAANSGGPLETVIDGVTGWLRPADEIDQWTEVMHQVLFDMPSESLAQMGEKGKRRVKEEFSRTKMARRLDEEIETMARTPRSFTYRTADVIGVSGVFGAVLLIVAAVVVGLIRTYY